MTKVLLRFAIYSFFTFLLSTVLSSCEHKPLYEPIPSAGKTRVRVNVDWSQFDDVLPSGMTVAFYPASGAAPISISSNDISRVVTSLTPGVYHVGVINYSITEFGTLDFEDVLSHDAFSINAKPTSSSWYTPDDGEVLALEPESFALDVMYDLIVPSASNDDDEILLATLHPVDVIYTLDITVTVQGISNLRSCAAVIQHMASKVLLSTLSPCDDRISHELTDWSVTVDDAQNDRGTLSTTLRCFGLPGNHSNLPEDNALKLYVLLVDNKTIMQFNFNVGDKFDHLSVRHLKFDITTKTVGETGIVILPETQNASTSGSAGFDVNVDEWSEDENIDIEI